MSSLAATLLAVAMLGVFALSIGGVVMWVKKGERQRGLLMIAAALVLLANVLIWTV